jgi:hypothetical protein
MVGFWGQITTLKLIHICCRSIQGHNIIRCKAFSNTIHNFCVENITKSETNCPWRWQWYEFVLTQDVTILFYANLPNRCIFFNLLNENTIFYFIKTKQSCYYFFFSWKYLLSYLCWLTHPGLNVSAPTFLVSRSQDRSAK